VQGALIQQVVQRLGNADDPIPDPEVAVEGGLRRDVAVLGMVFEDEGERILMVLPVEPARGDTAI
jgi:hypothetical protein